MTIVGALFAAAIGGLLVALVRMEYDRAADLRTRRIDATDELLQSTTRAFRIGRYLWDGDRDPAIAREEVRFENLIAATNEVEMRVARINLVFGQGTDISTSGDYFLSELRRLERLIDDGAPRTLPEHTQIFVHAAVQQRKVSDSVTTMLQESYWKRPQHWLEAILRRWKER